MSHHTRAMSSNETHSPFDYLAQLERKCRVASIGLPVAEDQEQQWSGLLFKLCGYELLVPMEDVVEIGDMPPVTHLPGVKPWVIGLTNMRGNLLPIMDLGRFLFGSGASATPLGRLLVVNHGASLVGLRVEAIIGKRHFLKTQRTENNPALPSVLGEFVAEGFIDQDQVRPVFGVKSFVNAPAFQDAAL